MATQNEIEERLGALVTTLERELMKEPEAEDRLHLVRALIHRAVHLGAERAGRGVEFCQVATYLSDMIGHAHKLMHGDSPAAAAHKELVH